MTEDPKDTIARLKGVPTKRKLEKILESQPVVVTFDKLDGEEREMVLTRDLGDIPEKYHPKKPTEPHETNITGWCITAEGWRSFRYDRLKKVVINLDDVVEYILAKNLQKEIALEIIRLKSKKNDE